MRWLTSFILLACDLGTRELLGAQEIGGGSASVATGYDLSGLRATHSDLLASGAWSANPAGETSQARGRPVVNDLLGRVTSLDGWNHTYSCDGLLLSSEPASPSEGSRRSVHAYDALGRRVRTVVQAYVGGQWVAFSTTERDFLGRLPLGIETSFVGGSSKSWRFLRGPDASGTLEGAGGARGVLAVLKDASSWKAVAADTLGNVLALAGTSGDFTRRTFDPWGNPLTRDASGNLRASTLSERRADYDALPLAWASQEVDPDTGLTHYHFREYSPSLGGWLTRDPIGLAGGYLNLRSYLGNRPADALDKEGRFAWVAPGAAIGGIIGGVFGAVVGAVDEYQTNPNASPWGLVKAGGKGLFVGAVAGAVTGSGVGLVAEVAVAGAGAAQAGLGAGGALTMAAHKANEVGIPQLIEAVGNPVPTAPVGAMVRTELGMVKAAGAGGKGAGQLGAKVSVAENATARAAAQAEASTLDKVKLPCAEAARGTPALPAPRVRGNPNTAPTFEKIVVDSKGNAIPLKPGEYVTGSPDGRFIQVRDASGNPTGLRIDGPGVVTVCWSGLAYFSETSAGAVGAGALPDAVKRSGSGNPGTKRALSSQPPASGSADPIGNLTCLFVSIWDGQVRGPGLSVGVSSAHHCGPFAWRVRFAGWLRRAMAALMLLPLVVASASSTVDLLGRDAAGRPLEVAATSSSGAQAGLLRTLDPEGAPLTQVDQSGKGWSFSRDLGTRELLGAQEIGGGSASVATGYDLSGLRATHSDLLASGAWSTNAAGETSQARGRPVVNDLLGRVTSLDGWNHTYSCDGLLLSSEPAAPAEGSRRSVHAYDALGRRVRTTVQAYVGGQWVAFSTTERDFLGRLPLGIETSFADGSAKSWRFMRGPDASGTLEGAGGARGVLAVLKDASSWKAVAADTLGNVLALAGVNGDFQRRTFDPWGNPITRDASGSLRASTLSERRADYDALPLAWASQEVDPDTGLTHYHFREYSPSLGGWLTQDPIGLAGGYLNLRSYLGNRPADALDKEGRFIWGFVIGAAADFIIQTVIEKKSLSKVNYYRVSASAVIGLATGGASALVSRGASATGASLAGRIAGQAMVGATASVTQNSVVNIDNKRPLAENAGKAAIAGALIAGAMEPLMEGAGAITDVVTEAYSETRMGISLIRGSSKSGGANAVTAEVSVAENATARAAAQAEASTLDKVKLPCAEAAKTTPQLALPGLSGAADDIVVLGRQVDTAVAKNWPGHKVLDIQNWTIPRNDSFMQSVIQNRQKVYLGSPQTRATLWDAKNSRPTVFSRELDQLKAGGYTQQGDYMLPPSN